MSLRFIYGRAGSGKSNFCFNDIKNKLNNDKKNNLILIVPEQFSFQSERNLIKKIGATGIINAEVLSFKRLCYKVFNEVGGVTRQHMNTSGKCMLLYKIIHDIRDELTAFAAVSNQKGFIDNVANIITEFKNYNITPESLNVVFENSSDKHLQNKVRDIKLIYETFQDTLHKRYIDQDDDLTILYDKIDESQYLKNCEIWIDEFSSFTPQQYNIIKKLLKLSKRVNITLCLDVEKQSGINQDVFITTKNTENKLIKIAMENNIGIDKPKILSEPYPRYRQSKELSCLERNFFSYSKKSNMCSNVKTKDISIFKASNSYSEIEFVARDIMRLCRENHYRFNNIAVVTRDLESYESIVKAVFTEYQIPYFIDKKKDIDNNPLIILIKSCIEIFTKNWSYESVFRYLKCGLIDIDKNDVDLLENYVLANGIRGKKKWLQNEPWNYKYNYSFGNRENSEEIDVINKVNEIRNKVTLPLIDLFKNIKDSSTVKEYCEAIFNFLTSINIYEKIQEFVAKFTKQGEQALAMEYSHIWNLIIELLDQVVEVMGNEEVSLDEFIKILSIGFSQHKMGLIPSALDQILVSSVERVKSHDIKVLYVVGVNDGVFPKVNDSEGIFNDIDKINLKNIGIELSSDTKTKVFEEQFLVYTTLSLPEQYLCVSYPIADFQGKALRPSIIISRLKDIFPNINEKEDVIEVEKESDIEWISRPIPTFNKLISKVRKNIEGESISHIWKDVYLWYKNNRQWRETLNTIFKGFNHKNTVGNITQEDVKKLYGSNPFYSVSRLEKYIQCPFAYYIQYGLRAKERKIFKYSAPDIGTLMHKIIDNFFNVVYDKNIHFCDIDKKWCADTISNLVDKYVLEGPGAILNSSPRYRYYKNRLKRVLIRAIWTIVLQIKKSGFEPLGYEMTFGYDGKFPPIEIELSNGRTVKLIGRIDRVDKFILDNQVFYRIIDYKSGNKKFSLSDVYYGFQIQLLTYLDAIITDENKINKQDNLPAGVFYFKIDDPLIKVKNDLSEEEIEKEIMKKLKLDGLVLSDTKIIKEMDKDISGMSLIVPAGLKRNGDISGRSKVATKEQFEQLRNHVRNTLVENCEKMLKGDISIKPYKIGDNTPCAYCTFSPICQFDTSLENSYRYIKEKSDKEVWDILKSENNKKNKERTNKEGEK